MRAAYIEQTGPIEAIKVGELPRPVPGPGQVLVKVGAVALNPIDLYVRSGLIAMPMAFPYIIGCDLAGTVEQVAFDVGERVKRGQVIARLTSTTFDHALGIAAAGKLARHGT